MGGHSSGQWRLEFRVDDMGVIEKTEPGEVTERMWRESDSIDHEVATHARSILRTISKVEPRPIRALYEDECVRISFVIDANSLSEAHGQQSRIHDSLSKAIEDKLGDKYAIEYDPPQEVEAGTKGT